MVSDGGELVNEGNLRDVPSFPFVDPKMLGHRMHRTPVPKRHLQARPFCCAKKKKREKLPRNEPSYLQVVTWQTNDCKPRHSWAGDTPARESVLQGASSVLAGTLAEGKGLGGTAGVDEVHESKTRTPQGCAGGGVQH